MLRIYLTPKLMAIIKKTKGNGVNMMRNEPLCVVDQI